MQVASLSSGAPAFLLFYCCFTAALLRLGIATGGGAVPAAQGAFGGGFGATTGGAVGSRKTMQVASLSSGVVCEYAVADLQFADGSSLTAAPLGTKFPCLASTKVQILAPVELRACAAIHPQPCQTRR